MKPTRKDVAATCRSRRLFNPFTFLLAMLLLGLYALLTGVPVTRRHDYDSRANRTDADKAPIRCFLYDRPPRTGSTTISTALMDCLRASDFAIASASRREDRPLVISRMLAARRPNRAAVRAHLAVSSRDVDAIRHGCDSFFYVTSCSPMWRRLASWMKYSLGDGHGNRTVQLEGVVSALQSRNFSDNERFLEAYPFTEESFEERHRLLPDYVIRSHALLNDTIELLSALGCRNFPTSENVHVLQSVDTDLLERKLEDVGRNMSLVFSDRRYKQLLQRAEQNNHRGLDLARQF